MIDEEEVLAIAEVCERVADLIKEVLVREKYNNCVVTSTLCGLLCETYDIQRIPPEGTLELIRLWFNESEILQKEKSDNDKKSAHDHGNKAD
jgi:hypothetical protein